MLDFIAGTKVFEHFRTPALEAITLPATRLAIARLCFFHLFLALAKTAEFYERYQAVLPPKCRDGLKAHYKEILDRGTMDLRSKLAGHIWDDETKRPLTAAEVSERYYRLVKNDEEAFLRWINDSSNNTHPHTLVGTFEFIRDELRAASPEQVAV